MTNTREATAASTQDDQFKKSGYNSTTPLIASVKEAVKDLPDNAD